MLAAVPEIFAVAVVATAVVWTVKVVVVAPARTVTDAGTVALPLSDNRVTTVPAEPAAPVRVTVPVDEWLPSTEVGLTETLISVAGLTVSGVVNVVPLSVALIVAVFTTLTGIVVTVKFAEVLFARIVTEVGTVAQLIFDDRVTTVPPVGAGPLMVTVPVEEVPPWTEVGKTLTLTSVGAVIPKLAV